MLRPKASHLRQVVLPTWRPDVLRHDKASVARDARHAFGALTTGIAHRGLSSVAVGWRSPKAPGRAGGRVCQSRCVAGSAPKAIGDHTSRVRSIARSW